MEFIKKIYYLLQIKRIIRLYVVGDDCDPEITIVQFENIMWHVEEMFPSTVCMKRVV